jgi:hypothetical protein
VFSIFSATHFHTHQFLFFFSFGRQIALHFGLAQKRVDLRKILETLVDPETQIRREFHIDPVRDFAALRCPAEQ